ncbi:MAG: alpha/beta hydrolase, partial [Chitinophagales bacterium]
MSELKKTHKYIKVNGINMHYVEQGEGSLLLLLHGFPEFWYSWRHQIPELAKHFHVVAPDLRGYNETDKPKSVSAYSIPEVTKDILELIENLGYEKAIVVAHDWGGAIGYELGMQHPEKLEKLVILNSPHPSIMKKHLTGNFSQLRRSWYMFFFQIPLLPEFFMRSNLRKNFKKTFRGWAVNKANFPDAVIEEYVKAFEKKGALTAAINWYRAALRSWKQPKSAKKPVSVPTLIIWGEDDKALGKELTYNMDKYFSAPYKVKYLSNCSHWVQNEYPDKV